MKHALIRTIAGTGLLLFGLAKMQAAPQQYQDQDPWHQSRDAFYKEQSWRMHFFDRVREDLDHVQTLALSGGDEYRIDNTKHLLNELQSKLAAGRFDQPQLDDAVAALEGDRRQPAFAS